MIGRACEALAWIQARTPTHAAVLRSPSRRATRRHHRRRKASRRRREPTSALVTGARSLAGRPLRQLAGHADAGLGLLCARGLRPGLIFSGQSRFRHLRGGAGALPLAHYPLLAVRNPAAPSETLMQTVRRMSAVQRPSPRECAAAVLFFVPAPDAGLVAGRRNGLRRPARRAPRPMLDHDTARRPLFVLTRWGGCRPRSRGSTSRRCAAARGAPCPNPLPLQCGAGPGRSRRR